MIYLKWKLSDGKFGINPIEAISNLGVSASTGAYVDAEGYRIGYLSESVDITQLDSKWDIEEVTESEALAFCQNFWSGATVNENGYINSEPLPELELPE